MEPVANAVTVREGDSTTVRCNNTGPTFFLLCTGGTWLGELGNCSQGDDDDDLDLDYDQHAYYFTSLTESILYPNAAKPIRCI